MSSFKASGGSGQGRGITRRTALLRGTAALAAAGFNWPIFAESDDLAAKAIERAHTEIWSRYIDKNYSTLYDYAALDGAVILPTPEDCNAGRPNALAWWTPIENGAFFGGLYLDALCQRWLLRRAANTAAEAEKIAHGLLKLASVGQTSGFIARGVAADGRSHFVCGSDDQTHPWFYGLWKYLKSNLPAAELKAQIVRKMEEVARVLESSGWRMPCDRAELGFRGSFAEANFIHAARLLFLLRAMYDVTQDSHWLALYREKLREKFDTSDKTRLALCAEGALYQPPGTDYRPRYPENPEFWTSASSQAALRALYDLEDDPEVRAQFKRGLEANAARAVEHVARFKNYDNDNTAHFEPDWRFLNELWREQTSTVEAVNVALAEVKVWNQRSPRRRFENESMREPLFAAWVAVLAGNSDFVQRNRNIIRAALEHYEWSKLYTSLFFIAENVYFEGIKCGL